MVEHGAALNRKLKASDHLMNMSHHPSEACCYAVALLAVVIMTFGSSSQVLASECTEEARAAAQLLDVEAGAHFDSGEHYQALEKWEEAYKICPNPITAWNIARSYEELKVLPMAREAFRLFLGLGELSKAETSRGQAKIQEIERRLTAFEEVDGVSQRHHDGENYEGCITEARAALDIHRAQKTIERLAVCQERRGELQGAIDTLKTVKQLPSATPVILERADAEIARLEELMNPVEEAPAAAPVVETVLPPPVDKGRDTAAWALVTGGVALAAGGTALTLFLVNMDKPDQAQALKTSIEASGRGCVMNPECGEFDDLKDDIEKTNLQIGVMGAIGGAALLTSVVLFIMDDDGDESEGSAGVKVLISPAGVGVAGSF